MQPLCELHCVHAVGPRSPHTTGAISQVLLSLRLVLTWLTCWGLATVLGSEARQKTRWSRASCHGHHSLLGGDSEQIREPQTVMMC